MALPLPMKQRASKGCPSTLNGLIEDDLSAISVASKALTRSEITVADFESVVRTFWVQAPPRPTLPAPLLIMFHGQGVEARAFAKWHNFSTVNSHHNLMTIYPQGMDDSYPGEEQGTGWNVGSAGNEATCVLNGVGQYYGCYKSCRELNKCGRCNWSTCYNDVLFVETLIKEISDKFCIDLDRIYAQGEGNGAQMVHHIVRELPSTFAGIATWFGTPLVGSLLGSRLQLVANRSELAQTAILAMHPRNDGSFPTRGGVSEAGWIFEPLAQSTGVWSSVHQCSNEMVPFQTKWDGGPSVFQCSTFRRCHSGRQIVQCMYDGRHGEWPSGQISNQMSLWFLLQFRRSNIDSEMMLKEFTAALVPDFLFPFTVVVLLGICIFHCIFLCSPAWRRRLRIWFRSLSLNSRRHPTEQPTSYETVQSRTGEF